LNCVASITLAPQSSANTADKLQRGCAKALITIIDENSTKAALALLSRKNLAFGAIRTQLTHV
jgi:hypothetical protein